MCLRGGAQSVDVCKVHLKDAKRHSESVDSCAKYAEPVWSLLDVFFCDQNDDRWGVAATGS